MLNTQIEQALNKQINHEMNAAYNYMAMAAYFEQMNLNGFSSWMIHQREEELEHAMRLYHFVLDRGGEVDLESVEKPKKDFQSVRKVFERSLELEKINTESIHQLHKLAVEHDDYATQSHLQWFIDEQVEEEKIMNEVLGLLDLAGENRSALLALNHQLGQRSKSQLPKAQK